MTEVGAVFFIFSFYNTECLGLIFRYRGQNSCSFFMMMYTGSLFDSTMLVGVDCFGERQQRLQCLQRLLSSLSLKGCGVNTVYS